MRKLSIVFCMFLAASVILDCHSVFAEEREGITLLEDFFITESVYPQGKGETQFTLSSVCTTADEGKTSSLAATIEYGLTDQFQIEVDWDAFAHLNPEEGASVNGSGDTALGFKYTFDEFAASGLLLAAGLEVAFPTGKDEVSENAYVYEPFLILSKDLGSEANLHASVAYGIVDPQEGNDEDAQDEISVSLGSVYRLAPDWRLTLEASMASNKLANGDETAAYLAPGILWKGIDDLEVGLAVARGLNDSSDNWQYLGMVSYEF